MDTLVGGNAYQFFASPSFLLENMTNLAMSGAIVNRPTLSIPMGADRKLLSLVDGSCRVVKGLLERPIGRKILLPGARLPSLTTTSG